MVLCRNLGLPARPVTNIGSAHDTDDSLTIDTFFDKELEEVKLNGDSTWNFHVWNDVWFARSDIPDGYSGWQVILLKSDQSIVKFDILSDDRLSTRRHKRRVTASSKRGLRL